MDYAPIDPEVLARIKVREKRRSAPSIDWAAVVAARDWVTLPMFLADDSREEWLREFYRLRKQARDWSAGNAASVTVRRDFRTRTVAARGVE